MKFAVLTIDKYDEHDIPDEQPIPEAYQESYWYPNQFVPENGYTIKAAIRDGKAVMVKEPFSKKPPEKWFTIGRNHQEADEVYTRELERKVWYVDIETLDTLIDFMRTHTADLDANWGYPVPGVPTLKLY